MRHSTTKMCLKKKLFYLLLLLGNFYSSQAKDCFIKIPTHLDKNKCVKHIDPNNSKIIAWQFLSGDNEFPQDISIKHEYGKYNFLDEREIKEGFFYECGPDYNCFNFVKLWDGNQIKYITTKEEFIAFLGYIDNIEEALLLIRTAGYWYDKNFKIGGSYKISDNFIEIYGISLQFGAYDRKFQKLKINRKTKTIELLEKGPIDGKKVSITIS